MTTAPAIDRRTWFTGFAIAITIALVAGLIASTGEVPGWEQSIFHAINDLPDWLEAPMWVFQLAGLHSSCHGIYAFGDQDGPDLATLVGSPPPAAPGTPTR